MIRLRISATLLLILLSFCYLDAEVSAQETCLPVGEEWLRKRTTKEAKNVKVLYPEQSRLAHVGGRAVVNIVVDEKGEVSDVKLAQWPDDFTGQAVVDAARQFRFKLGKEGTCYSSTLSFHFNVRKGEVKAAPDKYYHDRCRSAFESDTKNKALADAAPPLLMVAFGDSIMWGLGLRDRDKFWCRTKQWLELKMRRHVDTKIYAHSGAIIEDSDITLDPTDLEKVLPISPQGPEVNLSFPTINRQVSDAVSQLKGRTVHLVLVNGCINDLNFRYLLDTHNREDQIAQRTKCVCGAPMERLLERITSEFPEAYMMVTGYYPLIHNGVTEDGKKVIKGSSNNLITKLLIERLGGRPIRDGCKGEKLNACLEALSRSWYETSNSELSKAVDSVNSNHGKDRPPRIHFAEMNFPPDYAFSTKQSMLWNIRFGATNLGGPRKFVAVGLDLFRALDTNDDRWDERRRQYEETIEAFRERLKEPGKEEVLTDSERDRLSWFGVVCRRGSLAHPNRFGAALYAQAVIGRLESILPETKWATR